VQLQRHKLMRTVCVCVVHAALQYTVQSYIQTAFNQHKMSCILTNAICQLSLKHNPQQINQHIHTQQLAITTLSAVIE